MKTSKRLYRKTSGVVPKNFLSEIQERGIVSTGQAAAYKIKHANILLSVDVNGWDWTDEEAAKAFSCHRHTVANVRQRLVVCQA